MSEVRGQIWITSCQPAYSIVVAFVATITDAVATKGPAAEDDRYTR